MNPRSGLEAPPTASPPRITAGSIAVLFAFSIQHEVEKYGAYVGLAAFLGLAVLTVLYFAANQLKKSILNKIHRAKRGFPAAGTLPFGRILANAKTDENDRKMALSMITDFERKSLGTASADDATTSAASKNNVTAQEA